MALTSRFPPRPGLNATRARQGRFGRHVFWVLLISTVLAALGLALTWGLKSDELATTEANVKATPAEAAAVSAPIPAPVTTPPADSAQP